MARSPYSFVAVLLLFAAAAPASTGAPLEDCIVTLAGPVRDCGRAPSDPLSNLVFVNDGPGNLAIPAIALLEPLGIPARERQLARFLRDGAFGLGKDPDLAARWRAFAAPDGR